MCIKQQAQACPPGAGLPPARIPSLGPAPLARRDLLHFRHLRVTHGHAGGQPLHVAGAGQPLDAGARLECRMHRWPVAGLAACLPLERGPAAARRSHHMQCALCLQAIICGRVDGEGVRYTLHGDVLKTRDPRTGGRWGCGCYAACVQLSRPLLAIAPAPRPSQPRARCGTQARAPPPRSSPPPTTWPVRCCACLTSHWIPRWTLAARGAVRAAEACDDKCRLWRMWQGCSAPPCRVRGRACALPALQKGHALF